MRTLVVTGTDTDVGKTYVSCLLLEQLRATGVAVGAWKPVCSGSRPDESGQPKWGDIESLQRALGRTDCRNRICPQTFHAAVAPNVAAELEGREVNTDLILKGPSEWSGEAEFVVVEGAGGLLSPLSNTMTTADVADRCQSPLLIVAANRLGMINHTLLTVEVARQRGLRIAGIVVNTIVTDVGDDSRATNLEQLQRWLPEQLLLSVAAGSSEMKDVTGESFAAKKLMALFSQSGGEKRSGKE